MTEKYEYCSTVPRTWIVVIFSVKVSIFFCHILKICYYQYTCKTCITMKSQPILNLILTTGALTDIAFRREERVMKP